MMIRPEWFGNALAWGSSQVVTAPLKIFASLISGPMGTLSQNEEPSNLAMGAIGKE